MQNQTTNNEPHILPGPHNRRSFPRIELVIVRGQAQHLVRAVTGSVYLIGTALDCDLVLGDRQFPDVFAYMFVTEQGVSFRHLGVGPILTINGKVVSSTALFDGDVLCMGRFEFHVRVDWNHGPEPRQYPNQYKYENVAQAEEGLNHVQELLTDVRGEERDFDTSPCEAISSQDTILRGPAAHKFGEAI